MKNIEKFFKYFTNVLLTIVIICIFFALYSFIQLVILEKDYVNYFGYTVFEVQSGSMSPTINVDDMLLVKLTNEVEKDDIITYKKDNSFITHRVIEANGNKIITKGDSNNSEDKIIEKEDVLGKIVKIFPGFGKWKKILLSPAVLIAIFSTLTIFSFVFSYNDKKKDKVSDEEDLDNKKKSKKSKDKKENSKKDSKKIEKKESSEKDNEKVAKEESSKKDNKKIEKKVSKKKDNNEIVELLDEDEDEEEIL